MSLTVVTHTRGDRMEMLNRCKASVAAALPPGGKHVIVPCYHDWAEARLAAMKLDEFVAFVDDDDTVHPDALRHCLAAIQEHNAGVACTNEATVRLDGSIIHEHRKVKVYPAVLLSPRTLHHLCLIRTECVGEQALEIHHKYGMGVDWFIKAGAAFTGGAVHVPMTGYYWTQHPNTMTGRRGTAFHSLIGKMAIDIQETWTPRYGLIPVYEIPTA